MMISMNSRLRGKVGDVFFASLMMTVRFFSILRVACD